MHDQLRPMGCLDVPVGSERTEEGSLCGRNSRASSLLALCRSRWWPVAVAVEGVTTVRRAGLDHDRVGERPEWSSPERSCLRLSASVKDSSGSRVQRRDGLMGGRGGRRVGNADHGHNRQRGSRHGDLDSGYGAGCEPSNRDSGTLPAVVFEATATAAVTASVTVASPTLSPYEGDTVQLTAIARDAVRQGAAGQGGDLEQLEARHRPRCPRGACCRPGAPET